MASSSLPAETTTLPRVVWVAVRVVSFLVIGLLTSCIDGREEYWIAGNGSGRARIEYSVPSSIAAMEGGDEGIRISLEAFFKETPAIHNGVCEVLTKDGRTHVTVGFGFDSGTELAKVSSGRTDGSLSTAIGHLAGDVSARITGRTLEVERTTRPDKVIPASILLPRSRFDGRNLVYIIHLPAPARESNASRISDGGRTLCWETPLAATFKQPLTMRFKMDVPIPWVKILVSVTVLIFVTILCVKWLKARRNGCL